MSVKKAIRVLHGELREEFTINRSSLFCLTATEELIGISLDSSSHNPDVFYIWMYWLPLYAPTETVYFNLGNRICHKENEQWSLPLLKETPTLQSVAEEITEWKMHHHDRSVRVKSLTEQLANNIFHSGRALFYDFAMHHEFSEAMEVLESMLSQNWTKEWQLQLLQEMQDCSTLFSNHQDLDKRLRKNIETTKLNLRLR